MSRLHMRWMLIPLTVLIVSLMLAACGGGDDEQPIPPSATPSATASATPRFPPTWTPRPTNTVIPQPTITYTYVPGPTGSPVYLPTRRPTDIPPTINPVALTIEAQQGSLAEAAVPGARTTLLVPPSLVEAETGRVVEDVVGVFINEAPTVTFEDERIVIMITVIVGTEEARPVQIEAGLAIDDNNALKLSIQDAYFTDDDEPYNEAVADFMVGAVGTALDTVLHDRFSLLNPALTWFDVIEFQLTENELTVETQSVMPTATPDPDTEEDAVG